MEIPALATGAGATKTPGDLSLRESIDFPFLAEVVGESPLTADPIEFFINSLSQSHSLFQLIATGAVDNLTGHQVVSAVSVIHLHNLYFLSLGGFPSF